MLSRAYARRKRFEARLLAQEVAQTLFGPSPQSEQPKPLSRRAALREMGLEIE